MKDTNPKKKRSVLFELIILCVFIFAILLVCSCTSCGITSKAIGNSSIKGITIPGLGGCLSSGKGCNSCLYSESVACFNYNSNKDTSSEVSVTACDNVYLGSCLGCGVNRHHTSCGYISLAESGSKGCFYLKGNDDRLFDKSGVNYCGLTGCLPNCRTISSDEMDMGSMLDILESMYGLN